MLTMMGSSSRAVFVISVGDNVNPRWLAQGQRKMVIVNPIEVNGLRLGGTTWKGASLGVAKPEGARPPALVLPASDGNRVGTCTTVDQSGPVPAHMGPFQNRQAVNRAVNIVIGSLIFRPSAIPTPPPTTSLTFGKAPQALLASCTGFVDRADLNAQRAK